MHAIHDTSICTQTFCTTFSALTREKTGMEQRMCLATEKAPVVPLASDRGSSCSAWPHASAKKTILHTQVPKNFARDGPKRETRTCATSNAQRNIQRKQLRHTLRLATLEENHSTRPGKARSIVTDDRTPTSSFHRRGQNIPHCTR